MAINKVVNTKANSHGTMRNVLEYVLRDRKVMEGYVDIIGPYSGETINYDDIYQDWLREKKLWNKDLGKMYFHNVISFHKDEKVSPEDVLEMGRLIADKFFSGFQSVITVHQDKNHLHAHIVTNSVAFLDGHKYHQSSKDLKRQKEFTNDLCRERGLTIAEKGHHFDGSLIEEGEIMAWNKDKYNLLINDSKKSFVADCAIALLEVIPKSACREEFISGMEQKGWSVQWEEKRKHIVFQNENGKKVRDTNIEKTFTGLKVNKEALTHEFERQNEVRNTKPAIAGMENGTGDVRDHRKSEDPDTAALIREVRADISDSRSQSRAVIRSENQSVADNQQSVTREAERRLEEQRRAREQERAREARRRTRRRQGPSL